MKGIEAGETREDVAQEVAQNAAQSYQEKTMQEFGISEEEVWELVRDAIYK